MTTMVDDATVHTLLFAARITRDASLAYYTTQSETGGHPAPDNTYLANLEWQVQLDEAIVEFYEGMVAALPVSMHHVREASADASRQCEDAYAEYLPMQARVRMLARAVALHALTTMMAE